ncbi:hypothetical protein [Streptococcus oricebi]|uniref:DUF975 family protein n=1 Tax=Streptococcus oricebi TaxID=1547447 RepID=A0ABS5B5S3_9STRE|nr:hypothetical protein [Streptococcus oricebi]MBP2624193.1 hypothetical protein [Streptococcus oricebi]
MEKYPFKNLFDDSWKVFRENYSLWVVGSFLSGLLPTVISMVVFRYFMTSIQDGTAFSPQFFLIIHTALLFSGLGPSLIFKKYFLILVRQGALVKKHLLAAIFYSLTDGLGRRFYYFIVSYLILFLPFLPLWLNFETILPALLPYMGLAGFLILIWFLFLFSVVFGFLSILIASYFFLFPFIVQDTASKDNQLKALSYLKAVKKSIQLMKGQKRYYLLLQLILGAINGLGGQGISYVILFIGGDPFLSLMLFFILNSLFVSPYSAAMETFWADRLMQNDTEIVDYGD